METELVFEKWIDGFEGFYSVSSCGIVYSHHKKNDKTEMLGGYTMRSYKHKPPTRQYRTVTLSKNGSSKNYYIHKLVAQAFVNKIEGKDVVNHIDCCKTNNHFTNLEWVTPKENYIHAKENGLLATKNTGLRKKAITNITLNGKISNRHVEFARENPEHVDSLGVPPEILFVKRAKKDDSLIDEWCRIIDIFRLCDSNLSLSGVSKITGLNPSMVSLIRKGTRLAKHREIYEKYSVDDRYLKFYKPYYGS